MEHTLSARLGSVAAWIVLIAAGPAHYMTARQRRLYFALAEHVAMRACHLALVHPAAATRLDHLLVAEVHGGVALDQPGAVALQSR
eukprot:scaffold33275_cov76-Phaeocystis_antarctica.AAC.3